MAVKYIPKFSSCHGAAATCLLLLTTTMWLAGCSRGPQVAPAAGKVTFQGKPLEFGIVMFQPAQGQPARGIIQGDGTFTMSTFAEGDGAIVGQHKVRITCFESQRNMQQAAQGDQPLGKSLIPQHYTLYDQSGLTANIPVEGNDALSFDLE